MSPSQGVLIEAQHDDRIAINGRCFLRETAGCVVLFVRDQPVFSYDADDLPAKRLAMVQLSLSDVATQPEIAKAFGVKRLTVHRQRERYRAGGVQALIPKKRGPKGPRVTGGRRDKVIAKRKEMGDSNCQIAARLGVCEFSIRHALKRMGHVSTPSAVQEDLPGTSPVIPAHGETVEAGAPRRTDDAVNTSDVAEETPLLEDEDEGTETPATDGEEGSGAASRPTGSADVDVAVASTFDPDPTSRVLDRTFARLGLLEDAAPLFASARGVAGAGALLAIPVLVLHGVFADAARVFGSLGSGFYGVRNVVLTLLLGLMRGINRPEHLKRHTPSVLGQVMGLDRAPEMKTLRRKIRALARKARSLSFGQAQLKRHLGRLAEDLLWVYVDGHVSVYSGKRKLRKHHVTRLRLSMPAVLDYWVNDAKGDPLLVFTGRSRSGMVAVLRETIRELRAAGESRCITLVFDREGWSPALFAELNKLEGVRFVTYRKASRGKSLPRLAASAFEAHTVSHNGGAVTYELADTVVRIEYGSRKKRKRLELRQVTRLTETGKQTHVVTNDRETPAGELAHRMFSRWSQENFFKSMRHHKDFDGLVTYLMEDADPERIVANPQRTALRKVFQHERRMLENLAAAYGAQALDNEESARPTMRGFKIANGSLGQQVREQRTRVEELEAQLKELPTKVPLAATLDGEVPEQMHTETRRLMHLFRMSAHRAESGLCELFRSAYPRWHHESRELLRAFLNTAGDLEVADGELRVTLEAQSSPHRTRVLAHLCSELNVLGTRFPGSNLVLQFGVQATPDVSEST